MVRIIILMGIIKMIILTSIVPPIALQSPDHPNVHTTKPGNLRGVQRCIVVFDDLLGFPKQPAPYGNLYFVPAEQVSYFPWIVHG